MIFIKMDRYCVGMLICKYNCDIGLKGISKNWWKSCMGVYCNCVVES